MNILKIQAKLESIQISTNVRQATTDPLKANEMTWTPSPEHFHIQIFRAQQQIAEPLIILVVEFRQMYLKNKRHTRSTGIFVSRVPLCIQSLPISCEH